MDNSPDKYVEKMIKVTNNKYKLLQEVLAMTEEQFRSINEEGLEALEKLVAQKQIKIDDINKLDDEFNVYFHRLKFELKIKSLDELQGSDIRGAGDLKESVGKVIGILGEIFEVEKKNNDKAKMLLSEIGSEIKKLNVGKKINSVYRPGPVQAFSYFIDKKK